MLPLDIMDESNLRKVTPRHRLDMCSSILKNEADESKRWDAVYLACEIAESAGSEDPIRR